MAKCTGGYDPLVNSQKDGVPAQISDLGILYSGEDECLRETHNCHQNAACTNLVDGFSCACLDGYEGDGLICNDKNECENGEATCQDNSSCKNTDGSYECVCNEGFMQVIGLKIYFLISSFTNYINFDFLF